MIQSKQPVDTFLERLKRKVKKGGERFLWVLKDELFEADIPYGQNGQLPIANFQTIMTEYGIIMGAKDLEDLRHKGFIVELQKD